MLRRLSPILAAVVTSLLIAGLAWAAAGEPTDPTAATTATSAATSTVATEPVAGTFDFDAADAGTVTIESTGHTLTLVSATEADGWAATVEQATGIEIEVSFRSAADRVDFNAELEDGQIRVRVRSTDEETTTIVNDPAADSNDGTAPTTPGTDATTAPTTPGTDATTATTTPDNDGTTATTIHDEDDN